MILTVADAQPVVQCSMFGTFIQDPVGIVGQLTSFVGLGVMIGIAWVLSTNRQAIRWKPVVWGVTLQLLLWIILLSPELQQFFFSAVDLGVKKLLSFSEAGASFVF